MCSMEIPYLAMLTEDITEPKLMKDIEYICTKKIDIHVTTY